MKKSLTSNGKVIVMALCLASTIALNSCSRATTAAPQIESDGIASAAQTASDNIRLNQLGYYPQARKVAVIIMNNDSIAADDFMIASVPENGAAYQKIVFRGKLSSEFEWDGSGERGRHADFSALETPGRYRLIVFGAPAIATKNRPGIDHLEEIDIKMSSHVFEISQNVLRDVTVASMRTFYFQRCSSPLDEELVGAVWARPAGHPDTAVILHVSTGHEDEKKISSPGGWYDAGDFGKYMVNSGISMGTLLAFYENFPNYFPDNSLRIPESGNGRADILDEMKINLDWMLTMQDDDGGVFNKLTTLTFPGYIMPHDDKGDRYAIGKSTTAALNFAAVMAQASRVYKPFDEPFANEAIVRARRAWEWAQKNPNVEFKNPEDVKTGEYGDKVFDDEFIWAAAELFITTGDDEFAKFLSDKDLKYKFQPTWQYVHSLAPLSLAVIKNNLDEETLSAVRNSIIETADRWISEMDTNLYRIPEMVFEWGSNSSFANVGIGFIYAHLLTKDEKYLRAAAEIADYLLGKNAVGISFVTAFGSRFAANPHHRQTVAVTGIEGWSAARQLERQTAQNGADIVIPGFLVGGPNPRQQDKAHGVTYTYSERAKSYEDNYKSYASNEVAINWNSPATFLLGAVDALFSTR